MLCLFYPSRNHVVTSAVITLCSLFLMVNFEATAKQAAPEEEFPACRSDLIDARLAGTQVSLQKVIKAFDDYEKLMKKWDTGSLYKPSAWRDANHRGEAILKARVYLVNSMAGLLTSENVTLHAGQYQCFIDKYRKMESVSGLFAKRKYRDLNRFIEAIEANKLHTATPQWNPSYEDFLKELNWFVLTTHIKRLHWGLGYDPRITHGQWPFIAYGDQACGNERWVKRNYGTSYRSSSDGMHRWWTPASARTIRANFAKTYDAIAGGTQAERLAKIEERRGQAEANMARENKIIDAQLAKMAAKPIQPPKRGKFKDLSVGFRWWYDDSSGELVQGKYPRGLGDMELNVRGQTGTHLLEGVRFLGGKDTWGLASGVVRVGTKEPYGTGLVFANFQYTLSENGNTIDLNHFIWVPSEYEKKPIPKEEVQGMLSAPSGRGYMVYWNGIIKYGIFSSKEVGGKSVFTFQQTDDTRKGPPRAPEDLLDSAQRDKLEKKFVKDMGWDD